MKISSLSLVAGLFLACSLPAQTPRPSVADDFKPLGANWQVASGLGGDPRIEKKLIGLPGDGILVNNTTKENRAHLVTAWDHGDLELELDFLLTPGSNSGVYLMGRYEIQLFDSWGKRFRKTSTAAPSITAGTPPAARARRATTASRPAPTPPARPAFGKIFG